MENKLELIELGSRAREFLALDVAESQRGFVATLAESYADALFPEPDKNDPYVPWLRGILRNGTPTGFIMCADPIHKDSTPFLWRLLVDKAHQGFGVGRFAVTAALGRYRTIGFTKVSTSWNPRPGSPAVFYHELGFTETGEVNEGQVVAVISLWQDAAHLPSTIKTSSRQGIGGSKTSELLAKSGEIEGPQPRELLANLGNFLPNLTH